MITYTIQTKLLTPQQMYGLLQYTIPQTGVQPDTHTLHQHTALSGTQLHTSCIIRQWLHHSMQQGWPAVVDVGQWSEPGWLDSS